MHERDYDHGYAETLVELSTQIRELSAVVKAHIDREEKVFSAAFPSNDPVAHRLMHEKMIAASEAEARFWNEMKLDLAKKSAWGLLILVIGFAVLGISVKFGLTKIP